MLIFFLVVGCASIVILLVGKFRKKPDCRITDTTIPEFEKMVQNPEMSEPGQKLAEKQLHDHLASQGIRIFELDIDLYSNELLTPSHHMIYIHPNKTTPEWHADIRRIAEEIEQAGLSGNEASNALFAKLREAGYLEATDVVSDVYECRVDADLPGIIDSPIHSEQADGFGHYGWESKDPDRGGY
jgi:hypothetical protein